MREPLRELVSEDSIDGVLLGSKLITEPIGAEDWDTRRLAVDRPTLPGDPDVEIQETGGVCQGGYHLTLDGDWVLIELAVERFAQHDEIAGSLVGQRVRFVAAIEPELHAVDEVEASPIHDELLPELVFRSKEDRGGEDALKSTFHSAVLSAIFGQPEVVDQLSWAVEMKGRALLLEGECRQPDGYQSVLAVR